MNQSPFPCHICHHIWFVLKYKIDPHEPTPFLFISIQRCVVLGLGLILMNQSTVPCHICHHIWVVLGFRTVPHESVPVPYIYIKYRYAVLGLELTMMSVHRSFPYMSPHMSCTKISDEGGLRIRSCPRDITYPLATLHSIPRDITYPLTYVWSLRIHCYPETLPILWPNTFHYTLETLPIL